MDRMKLEKFPKPSCIIAVFKTRTFGSKSGTYL